MAECLLSVILMDFFLGYLFLIFWYKKCYLLNCLCSHYWCETNMMDSREYTFIHISQQYRMVMEYTLGYPRIGSWLNLDKKRPIHITKFIYLNQITVVYKIMFEFLQDSLKNYI